MQKKLLLFKLLHVVFGHMCTRFVNMLQLTCIVTRASAALVRNGNGCNTPWRTAIQKTLGDRQTRLFFRFWWPSCSLTSEPSIDYQRPSPALLVPRDYHAEVIVVITAVFEFPRRSLTLSGRPGGAAGRSRRQQRSNYC